MEKKKLYMSIQQALDRYGIGKTSLYELFAEEDCPTIYKFGRKVMIPVEAFDAFFQSKLERQTTQLHAQAG